MMKKYILPELPYGYSALEPHISSETLQYHYKRHHAGYVDKLNDLVDGTKLAGNSLEYLIKSQPPGKIFNNASQVFNHTFYWNSMTPNRNMQPTPELADLLNTNFGSISKFMSDFAEAATGQFGSGWAWLVKTKSGELQVISTANAESPLQMGLTPLLVCDVWEHAYYIDYRNDRGIYVEKFLELLNWEFIDKNLAVDDAIASDRMNKVASLR